MWLEARAVNISTREQSDLARAATYRVTTSALRAAFDLGTTMNDRNGVIGALIAATRESKP